MNEFLAPILRSGDILADLSRWVSLDPGERKRRAAEAARDRNAAVLWQLTEAHILLYGGSAAKTSRHTLSAYRTSITMLLRAWPDVPLLRPRRDQAALYIRSLESAGKSPATVSVRLAGARALYRALRWTEATEADPFKDVRPARDTVAIEDKRKPYSESDIAALLAHATGSDRLLVLLAGRAGMRNQECCNLRWEHVDLPGRKILVFEGKGRKTASVPMAGTLADALAASPRISDYVIPEYRTTEQARRRLKALCLKAGVRPLGVHSLRHAAGTKLQAEVHDVTQVQKFLRHSSPETTVRYIHLADRFLNDRLADW